MKLLLWLDDWFIDRKLDMVRRFPEAQEAGLLETCPIPRVSITYDHEAQRLRAIGMVERSKGRHAIWESRDGLHWTLLSEQVELPYEPGQGSSFPFEQTWFYDPWDLVSNRRYKMLVWPYIRGIEGGPGILAYSPDGVRWTLANECVWFKRPNGSDTTNNLFYNPLTKRWCVICRPWNLDRRVALVESGDLQTWTEPRVIIHPDAMDDPLLQFYGMGATLYENEYFIGVLQCFHVTNEEINAGSKGRVKVNGAVDGQLAYSYDGYTWIRPNRKPLVPRLEPGRVGGGGIYPFYLTLSPDRSKVLIYSLATERDHSNHGREGLAIHTLRRDGFAYMEPVGGWGSFATRTMIPQSGELRLNYQAPSGTILVQITDSMREPIEGYSFAECLPLTGDELDGNVRWREHDDIAGLVGKPVQLEFKMLDARLFSVRMDIKWWYTNTPHGLERV